MTQTIYSIKRVWDKWVQTSANRQIFGAATIVAAMTLFVKLVGFGKDLLIAYTFGTSDELDAFFIALVLPSLLVTVFAGSIEPAFIPTYIQTQQKEGRQVAQQLLSSVLVIALVLLIVIPLVVFLVLPYILPLIGSGFNEKKLALTYSLSLILLFLPVINGLSIVFASVLRAGEQFAISSVTPSLVSFGMIACLVVVGKSWGIYALATGMIAGTVFEAVVLAWQLKHKGFSLFPRWYGITPTIRQVVKQYIPMIAGAFLMSSTNLVDQSMAAMVGSGSVATLNYGNKVIALVLGLGSASLGAAVIPYFSRMVANEDWANIRHTLKTYTSLIFIVSLPFIAVLFFFSEPIVTLMYKRGAFTSEDAQLVAQVQAMYALQVPFYIMSILVVRVLSALKLNHFLFWGATINLTLNVLLNYVFTSIFGLKGIALSTSGVHLVSWFLLTIVLYRNIPTSQTRTG